MSKRHQKSQTSVVPEPREDRKREHRRLRQKVRQDLHVASVEGERAAIIGLPEGLTDELLGWAFSGR